MSQASHWRLKLVTAGVVAFVAAAAFMASGCSGDDGPVSVECDSTLDYYALNVEGQIQSHCGGCHREGGQAAATSYKLNPPAVAGFLEKNLEVVKHLALTEREGKSLWLLKPTLQVPHEGGHVIKVGDPVYNAMLGLVVRLKNDEVCEPKQTGFFTGVELHGVETTLRKAAILLAGRLPTAEEVAFVQEHGFPGLEAVLDKMMEETGFEEWLHITFNDLFLTDLYVDGGTDIVCPDEDNCDYADPFWFTREGQAAIEQYGLTGEAELERFTNISIAREGTALIQYVVKNNLPFTEILEADHTMVTPLSQRSFGAELIEGAEFSDPHNPLEFQPARIPERPHAGVLTSFAWLNRHPTTETNRNRARSRKVYLWFLGTDILALSKQPINQNDVTVANPTRNQDTCKLCHALVDPIAGTFQAFDAQGQWNPEPEWYDEMWLPGFAGEDMPQGEAALGLQWLVKRVVRDERFPIAAVQHAYRGLIGREPMRAPDDYADPLFQHKFRGFLAQANTFRAIAEKFRADNYNFKTVVKELVMTPYFRAKNAVALSPEQQAQLANVGMAQLLKPEILHRKIQAVLGAPWGGLRNPNLTFDPRDPSDPGQYQLFFGGQDSDEVTNRVTEPNGVMAAVAERMAIQMSCFAVPNDFAQLAENRTLFPMVEVNGIDNDPMDLEPQTPNGLDIPAAQQGIKQALVHLHERVLGEKLPVDHPEIDAEYQLFLETWNEGKQKILDDELGEDLPSACEATEEFYTGTPYPEEQQVTSDPGYTIRAWMAVLTYMLSDYQFLYE